MSTSLWLGTHVLTAGRYPAISACGLPPSTFRISSIRSTPASPVTSSPQIQVTTKKDDHPNQQRCLNVPVGCEIERSNQVENIASRYAKNGAGVGDFPLPSFLSWGRNLEGDNRTILWLGSGIRDQERILSYLLDFYFV